METPSAGSAGELRDQFLHLLVTQLRHQDPLSPMEPDAMLSQLAEFSSVEGIEALNGNFESFLHIMQEQQSASELARAADLIGHGVTYSGSSIEGHETTGDVQEGTVESVLVSDDRIQLQVSGNIVAIDEVLSVTSREATAQQ